MLFRDRVEAGRELAVRLRGYAGRANVIVLALPRGGVIVAYEVAKELQAPLDVFLVRKLGVPGHEELAFGAIASGGERVLNHEVMASLDIPGETIEAVTRKEQAEVARRERLYRRGLPRFEVAGRIVILVDDGIATGSTMRAAVLALREEKPARLIVAVPVAAPSACQELAELADEMITVEAPEFFYAVGQWYGDFRQVEDDEVCDVLTRARVAAVHPAA